MPEPIDLLFECEGVNDVDSPTRIGANDIQYGLNVVVTEDKKLERADGFTKVVTLTDGHSLWYKPGGSLLVCDGTTLYVVGTDYSLTSIKTGLSGEYVSYDQQGAETYFCDGTNTGKVYGSLYEAWPVGAYRGATTDRYFETTVPPFNIIGILNYNRMFGVIGNALYQSEIGEFGLWDLKHTFLLPQDIRMVATVHGGLFVSDGISIWFLQGNDLRTMTYFEVSNYPALWNGLAAQTITGTDAGIEDSNNCVLFNTKEGPCLGTSTGQLINLTRDKNSYPAVGETGASLLRGYDLICVDENEFCTQTALTVGNIGYKANTNRSNFAFNSFARRGEEYLACSSDGIYLLGGDTFNGSPISAAFESRTLDFERKGGVDFLYTGAYETTGNLTVTPTVDKVASTAKTILTGSDKHHIRTKMGKGLSGRIWKFRFENVAGGDFSIERIQYLPRPKNRAFPS